MNNATIKISGKTTREPREINNSIELYFKIPMSEKMPKGLKNLGKTSYKVIVTKKMWNKIEKEKINENTLYLIKGEVKAFASSDCKPYIIVNCTNIEVKESEKDNSKCITKELKKDNNWRNKINEEEVVEIDLKDIDIESSKHKYSIIEIGDKIGINSIIAVSKKENGRYSLIAGFKAFASAMIYRSDKPIKAYIYNGDRDEFKKEFKIEY